MHSLQTWIEQYRQATTLTRRDAFQAGIFLRGENHIVVTDDGRPDRDRAREPDVGDGQRQYLRRVQGDRPEFECRAADSAKHAQAGNGTPQFDGGTSAIGRYG